MFCYRVATSDGADLYFHSFIDHLLAQVCQGTKLQYEILPLNVWMQHKKQEPHLLIFSHFGKSHDSTPLSEDVRRLMISCEPLAVPVMRNPLHILIDTKLAPHYRLNITASTLASHVPFALTSFWERWVWSPHDLLPLHSIDPKFLPPELQSQMQTSDHKTRTRVREEVLNTVLGTAKPKTKFCVFLYERPVDFRNAFFYVLSQYKPVDDLGLQPRGNTCPEKKGKMAKDVKQDNSYDMTIKLYSEYKFSICFENSIILGYVTEKLINGLFTGIPIYYGAPDVARYFNPKRFINVADFPSFEACADYVAEVDQDETLYQSYLKESPLPDGDTPETWTARFLSPVRDCLSLCIRAEIFKSVREKALETKKAEKEKPIGEDGRISLGDPATETKLRVFPEQCHFVTFASGRWKPALARIGKEVSDLKVFKHLHLHDETSLFSFPEFAKAHKEFIEDPKNKRGFGFWLWKPFLIWKTLQAMKEGDVMVYADAGCKIRGEGLNRLHQYLNRVAGTLSSSSSSSSSASSSSEFLCFHLREEQHTNFAWTKMDTIHALLAMHAQGEDASEEKFKKRVEEIGALRQLVGGILVIKKSESTMSFVQDWYKVCSNYHLLDNTESAKSNHASFVEHRHDQSVLSLMVALSQEKVKFEIVKDETWWDPDWEKQGGVYPIWALRLNG